MAEFQSLFSHACVLICVNILLASLSLTHTHNSINFSHWISSFKARLLRSIVREAIRLSGVKCNYSSWLFSESK